MSIKKKGQKEEKGQRKEQLEEKEEEKGRPEEICDFDKINELYSKKCGLKNKEQLIIESKNRKEFLILSFSFKLFALHFICNR